MIALLLVFATACTSKHDPPGDSEEPVIDVSDLYYPVILPRRLEGRIQAAVATGAQGPRPGATGCLAMYQNLRRRFW